MSDTEKDATIERVIESMESYAGQFLEGDAADFLYRQADELRMAVGQTIPVQHVVPVNDLFDHDTSGEACLCGTETDRVEGEDGSMGFVAIHRSLDGREANESGGGYAK